MAYHKYRLCTGFGEQEVNDRYQIVITIDDFQFYIRNCRGDVDGRDGRLIWFGAKIYSEQGLQHTEQQS